MKEIARLVVVLTLITAVAGVVLATVEALTREPIAEQRRQEMLRALQAVLPVFDNDPGEERLLFTIGADKRGQPLSRSVHLGKQAGLLSGVAFAVSAADGYSGEIQVMLGLLPDGSVQALRILHHLETPGLGDKIEEESWRAQFVGQSLESRDWRVKKDGGEFDQLTGATISARAVVGAVRAGLEFFAQHREQIVAEHPDKQEAAP